MRFRSRIEPDGVIVTAERKHFLNWTMMALAEWGAAGETRPGVCAYLLGLVDRQEACARGDEAVFLPNETAVNLPQAVAGEIGLPILAGVSVTLSFEGRVEQADSRIHTRWYENERVILPKRAGVGLSWVGKSGRLSAPLWHLMAAIDGFNRTGGADPEQRIAAWQPVQSALLEATGTTVRADDYLNSLTIYQAGAFALDVRQTSAGVDFLPVVMAKSKAPSLEDDAPVGDHATGVDLRDEVADALLPPELQRALGNRHFARGATIHDAYVLKPNTFLVLDPDLKLALDVVQRMRTADEAERRAFLRNPRSRIASELEAAGRPTLAVSLFVETEQYSDRVLGLGMWEPPKLPWLAKRAGQWLPEVFPFKIGTHAVTMTSAALDALEQEIVRAEAQAVQTIEVQGIDHPVSEVRQALMDFEATPFETEKPFEGDGIGNEEEPETPEVPKVDSSQILVIKSNLDGVEYRLTMEPRPVRIARAMPMGALVITAPKPHQTSGFDWLVEAWAAGWPGVLLADDMGLGKTFQALAFLAWARRNKMVLPATTSRPAMRGPTLIVAPTALLRNWTAEARRHLAREALGPLIEAFGSRLSRLKRPREADWTPEDSLDLNQLQHAGCILTTYETLADNHRAFARLAYSVVVFDEMQKIKSPGTINTHAAKALNADFVLGLTGTPIENRIEDLWCLMDRVVPGYLGDLKSFAAEHGGEAPTALADLKAKLDTPQGTAPSVMMRRMKEAILDGLPSKTVRKYPVTMPPAQAKAYGEAVAEARGGARNQGAMLRAIQAFRGISLHPEGPGDTDPFDARMVGDWAAQSARIAQAVAIIDGIRDVGEKAIVFVEDIGVQKLLSLAAPILFKTPGMPSIINGSTPGDRRQAIVDGFQADVAGFDLLLLSPKAAGVGLTITAANHVVHLSRWWNPAVEDQCNDRVYRIGQERPVSIHIPVARHPMFGDASFDETLDALLERKRALSRHMLAPPVAESDIDNLFGAAVGAETTTDFS